MTWNRHHPMTAIVVVATLLVSGCGSDDDSEESSDTTTVTDAVGPELEEYCERAAAYLEATESIDTTEVRSIVEGFEQSAVAARAVADVAPAAVKTAHERLAGAAEDLAAGLTERAPHTVEALQAANEELVGQLTAEYGNLEPETDQAQSFATEECGLSFD